MIGQAAKTSFPMFIGWKERKWHGIAEDCMVPVIRGITRVRLNTDERAGCYDVILRAHQSLPAT